MELKVGMKNTLEITATDQMCADHNDSQFPKLDMPHVFSTPSMINLMEFTCAQLMNQYLDDDQRSVGMAVDVKHLAATQAGEKVTCECEIIEIDGRKILFQVTAHDEKGLIGKGTHKRAVVRKG